MALLMWKNYRQIHESKIKENVDIAEHITFLARHIGVSDEFFKLMMVVPIMDIKVKELEQWEIYPGYLIMPKRRVRRKRPSSKQSSKKKNTDTDSGD